jgi:hypothetical protein
MASGWALRKLARLSLMLCIKPVWSKVLMTGFLSKMGSNTEASEKGAAGGAD